MNPVSMVVLTWNGKHLLEECLPSVVEAAEHYGGPSEIIVVDDGSTDGSVEYLREHFPRVSVIALKENTGFQVGSNTGIKAARYDLVFLLNNDILLEGECIAPLAAHFTNEKLFAVGPLMRFPGSEEVLFSACGAQFRRGVLTDEWAARGGVDHCAQLSPTLYTCGGAMMFQKRIFEELGMFHHLYSPFYCEDVDICYQAWKCGYYVLYEPRSVVYHKSQATISKMFSKRYYEFVNRRNWLLLMWRNLTDKRYLAEHLLFLFPRLAGQCLRGERAEVAAFLGALGRLPYVVRARMARRKPYTRSDAEICEMLNPLNLLAPNLHFEIRPEGLVDKRKRT
jgi:GT2 family glycosyltransferase